MRAPLFVAVSVICSPTCVSATARAELADGKIVDRKVQASDLSVPVERYVLPNGLTVLLSPDPNAEEVLVDLAFRAGALYEPPKKNGIAHLVEHMLTTGTSSTTDYVGMLECAGARAFNAFTSAQQMVFRALVPAEALALTLWVQADRLGTLPTTWSEPDLQHHRSVVEVERLWRNVDVHFGPVDDLVRARTFPASHPLHRGISGNPRTLDSVTLADVQGFVKRHMSPANGVLVLVGAFDPEAVKPLIAQTLGALPPGAAPTTLRIDLPPPRGATLSAKEKRSRRPRVTFVWRLPLLGHEDAAALELGALLIESYIDGAFGTHVAAWVEQYPGGGSFRLDLTLPYDKPIEAAQAEAEALLRYLTSVDMPRDVFAATKVRADLETLFTLDTLAGRARVLEWAQLEHGDAKRVGRLLSRHWRFRRHDIQHIAWKTLKVGPPRIVVHARPVHPIAARVGWDERVEGDAE